VVFVKPNSQNVELSKTQQTTIRTDPKFAGPKPNDEYIATFTLVGERTILLIGSEFALEEVKCCMHWIFANARPICEMRTACMIKLPKTWASLEQEMFKE
jgi:hypothetical protein